MNKNPDLWMQGTILPRAGGHVLYVESLRDSMHGNKLVMHSEADCAPDEASAAPRACATIRRACAADAVRRSATAR